MDRQRALADLAEVRLRLAGMQRFDGYSAGAAAISAFFAFAAGFIQFGIVPHPRAANELHAYTIIWLGCLCAALVVNYSAVGAWLVHQHGRAARAQFELASFTMLPAIAFGGLLTVALLAQHLERFLPGVWFGSYAVGLFASRASVPPGVVTVGACFGVVATALLLLFADGSALAWWVMPLGFGVGQLAIAASLWADHRR